MRKLASIQTILDLQPIPGADAILLAKVLGWQLVVKKTEFVVGQKCVFFEIDSLLPIVPWSDFLRKGVEKPYRLKTVRLRGQLSQGLALPLSDCGLPDGLEVGTDVTEQLGVTKWEPVIPPELAGVCKGNFPSFIPKTDEPRLQAYPELLDEVRGMVMRGTLKMDGTSFTCFRHQGVSGVCSRNMELCESDTNTYWKVAKELELDKNLPNGYALQGEICGPGVQGNRMGLDKLTLFAFSTYDIGAGRYVDHGEHLFGCAVLGVKTVPLVFEGVVEKTWTVARMLDFASEKNYDNGLPAEGIVWRPEFETYSPTLKGRLSFKTISNRFLEKYKE